MTPSAATTVFSMATALLLLTLAPSSATAVIAYLHPFSTNRPSLNQHSCRRRPVESHMNRRHMSFRRPSLASRNRAKKSNDASFSGPNDIWNSLQGSASEYNNQAVKEAETNSISDEARKTSQLAGMPIGPNVISTSTSSLTPSDATSISSSTPPIIIRYMYEGGHIAQGRLCLLRPIPVESCGDDSSTTSEAVVTIPQIIQTLADDGVDFDTFYACAYESGCSSGGWMPLEEAPRYTNPFRGVAHDVNGDAVNVDGGGVQMTFPIPSLDNNDESSRGRRIDIKLFRRPRVPLRTSSLAFSEGTSSPEDLLQIMQQKQNEQQRDEQQNQQTPPSTTIEHTSDALYAISSSTPNGYLPLTDGYFAMAILNPKTSPNIGTLLRSAYQLGASLLYTIGTRYKSSSTDTINVPARIPLIELDDWNSFAEHAAPKSAVWVVIEMGGTPLEEFIHPRNAIYILGSEDHGVPKAVVRGCREVVSLECVNYGSYNVAVAGSLVMYDRMVKLRRAEKEREEKKMAKKKNKKMEN